MAMNGYFMSPPTPGLESHHQIVLCHIQDTLWEESYASAFDMQLIKETKPRNKKFHKILSIINNMKVSKNLRLRI